jgi:hypothetical protein
LLLRVTSLQHCGAVSKQNPQALVVQLSNAAAMLLLQ